MEFKKKIIQIYLFQNKITFILIVLPFSERALIIQILRFCFCPLHPSPYKASRQLRPSLAPPAGLNAHGVKSRADHGI